MEGITVEKLALLCELQIRKGNGKKEILISDDDEGNGYHTLFYGFTDDIKTIKALKDYDLFHDDNDPEDVVILG